jgi:hypothetical protein
MLKEIDGGTHLHRYQTRPTSPTNEQVSQILDQFGLRIWFVCAINLASIARTG